MEFTTTFELQSQTTRLLDICLNSPDKRESHPLCCPVPRDLARMHEGKVYRPQFSTKCTDSHSEHTPLQSPLLGESLLVSFPPLNYMLKFSGSLCLTWDPTTGNNKSILSTTLIVDAHKARQPKLQPPHATHTQHPRLVHLHNYRQQCKHVSHKAGQCSFLISAEVHSYVHTATI